MANGWIDCAHVLRAYAAIVARMVAYENTPPPVTVEGYRAGRMAVFSDRLGGSSECARDDHWDTGRTAHTCVLSAAHMLGKDHLRSIRSVGVNPSSRNTIYPWLHLARQWRTGWAMLHSSPSMADTATYCPRS